MSVKFELTYIVFAFCMFGMILGLSVGKSLMLAEQTFANIQQTSVSEPGNPKCVYIFGAILSSICMLAASLVVNTNFWIFAILFGGFNGFFAGIAYQAPMHAVQLYFPDRKGTVSMILLFSMAAGIGLYSYLTLWWASSGQICDL